MSRIPVSLLLGKAERVRLSIKDNLTQIFASSVFAPLRHSIPLAQGVCLCCQLHNETSETLRNLFMQALQRRIKPFQHLFLDCHENIDPANIIYTLGQEFFLKERFVYEATLLVLEPSDIVMIATSTIDTSLYKLLKNTDAIVVDENKIDREQCDSFYQQLDQLYRQFTSLSPLLKPATIIRLAHFEEDYLQARQDWLLREHQLKKHRLFL
ncbi:hypothetical protein V757_04155 [Pelistega indica]|uniref:CobW/HypB/UreG nucleotide-binding domain-containing protein n=1 Tax=Pelistega indica TaxID=1414851 RepID=V8G7G8_9BURK|nr:GTP-binding protein [Pelistega indica]ETD72459.1 hypothetical protein V757_04155 [Pelistega indica]